MAPRQDNAFKRYCSVYGCLNKRKIKDALTFFSIPFDVPRRQKWLTLIDREDLDDKNVDKAKKKFVCSEHFDDSAIITSITKRLKNDAVPTKLLPQKTTGEDRLKKVVFVSTYTHIATQTDTKAQSHALSYVNEIEKELEHKSTVPSELTTCTAQAQTFNSQRKRELTEDIEFVECKRKCLELNYIKTEKDLEAENALLINPEDEVAQRFTKLIEWQNQIKNKFKDNCHDDEYKTFALNFYYASPCAYRCLQTVLKLPGKRTLNRIKCTLPPQLDDRVLNSLSLKIKSLPENAKYCTICVDEMELKRNLFYDIKKDEVIGFHNINGTASPEIASHAYVMMLQGIYCNWKQPIAYALLGRTEPELDSWINEVLLKLFGVGIDVKAIISDQESNFDQYAKVIKNVSIDKPYFFVDEHKIFYIFDVPHLFKCVRNDLLSSDFHYKKDKISWDHIKTLYEHQKDKNLSLIPKITSGHVEPDDSQRMEVKYAVQIFSDAVSAALDTYIDFGAVTEEGSGTAKFLKIMNDIFDVLNSSKRKPAKKHQSAFRMTSEQKLILQDAQHMFATIKSTDPNTGRDNTNQMKTCHNFQVTIQSVLQLFEDLHEELQGFEYLFTRRLNKDSLDILFGSIRQHGGTSEPTPIQFTRAFSKSFHVNMLKSDQTNCESDINEILLKAEDIINKESIKRPEHARTSLVALGGEIEYQVDLPEKNALTYIAGFLLYKCSVKHPSCIMIGMFDSSQNLDRRFTDFKAYNTSKSCYGKLKMPSQKMNEYVQKLENVFTHNFEHHLNGNIGSEIFELLEEVQLPTLPCSCFPVDYLLRLFVRLRIYSTIKFNNQNLKSGKKFNQYLKVKQL